MPAMARPSPQTDRLIAVIDLLASRDGEGLSLSDIARRLGLSPVTCHPMLASLLKAGWLVRHPTRKTYRLGPALAAIGTAAAAGFSAVELSHPVMVDIEEELKLSCLALVPGEDHATIVDIVRASPLHDASMRIGDRVPFQPPLGMAYIAWQDSKAVARWLSRAGNEADAKERFEELLAVTRERGYSIDLVMPDGGNLRELLSRFDQPLRPGHDLAASTQLLALLEQFAKQIAVDRGYAPVELEPERLYGLGSVSTPVFDRDGDICLILALRGFDAEVTGTEARKIGERLVAGADGITAAIGGTRPENPSQYANLDTA
jgi:DNA-binding IclR family transcriptional regulator